MQIIFDLDGTIIDSSSGILGSLRYTFDTMGFPLLPEAEMHRFIGPPLVPAMMEIVGVDRETAEKALEVYRSDYRVNGVLGVRVYDGVAEMLEKLHAAGHGIHLGTSKPELFAEQILGNVGLRHLFTHVCGATFDGTRDKKAEVLAELFRRGGVDHPGRETLTDWRMVGDRIYDVEGAAAFGLDTIGVLWGFGPREEFADAVWIAETPAALADYLL